MSTDARLLVGGDIVVPGPAGARLLTAGYVLVVRDRISSVGAGRQAPSLGRQATTLDVSGCVVVPGFVNTHHLVAAFCEDDDFDTDQGYRGTNQFWFGIKPPWQGSSDSRGFETEGDLNQGATGELPLSQWVVHNATLIGRGKDGCVQSAAIAQCRRQNLGVPPHSGRDLDRRHVRFEAEEHQRFLGVPILVPRLVGIGTVAAGHGLVNERLHVLRLARGQAGGQDRASCLNSIKMRSSGTACIQSMVLQAGPVVCCYDATCASASSNSARTSAEGTSVPAL